MSAGTRQPFVQAGRPRHRAGNAPQTRTHASRRWLVRIAGPAVAGALPVVIILLRQSWIEQAFGIDPEKPNPLGV